jgi:hypothetical protein
LVLIIFIIKKIAIKEAPIIPKNNKSNKNEECGRRNPYGWPVPIL